MTGCEPTEVKCRCECHPTGIRLACFKCMCNFPKIGSSTLELEKRIEALEKRQKIYEDVHQTVYDDVEENGRSIWESVEKLEQERDKGIKRLKELEQLIRDLQIKNHGLDGWKGNIVKRLEALESNLSQQNPVTDVAQDHYSNHGRLGYPPGYFDEKDHIPVTDENLNYSFCHLCNKLIPGYCKECDEKDHIADAGKKTVMG